MSSLHIHTPLTVMSLIRCWAFTHAWSRSELVEKGELVTDLETSKSALLGELEKVRRDAYQLRSLLISEHDDHRRTTSRFRAQEKHLSSTVADLQAEAQRRESILQKALQNMKEERRVAAEKHDAVAKELSVVLQREGVCEKAKRDKIKELEVLERRTAKEKAASEEVVRRLAGELQGTRDELSLAVRRAAEREGDHDVRLKACLKKLQAAEQELANSRCGIHTYIHCAFPRSCAI